MIEDFNKLFWSLLGIKRRVYDVEDILLPDNSDREAVQKRFERFLKEPLKLSNEKYFELLFSEANIFYQFF
ncbi:MAG: hypothetical protein LBP54_08260 [Campylobacteraceae bacterium]|jgi:hypothetical protein|nr:hypothetical protein [Campylobacteraceae bacterium]